MQTWGDDTGDLSALKPAGCVAAIVVYFAGVAFMTRAYRQGRMRLVLAAPLLLPVAVVAAAALVMVVVGPDTPSKVQRLISDAFPSLVPVRSGDALVYRLNPLHPE